MNRDELLRSFEGIEIGKLKIVNKLLFEIDSILPGRKFKNVFQNNKKDFRIQEEFGSLIRNQFDSAD